MSRLLGGKPKQPVIEPNLDEIYEQLKADCNADLDAKLDQRGSTRILLKNVHRRVAHFQHMCREQGDMDLVYQSGAFLKSLTKMTYGLKSAGRDGGGGF
jgi:hypothetical protein